MYDDFHYEIIV